MSELLTCEIENRIATITLHNGKVNAFSHEMIAAFNEALDRAEEEKAVVVITGQPGIFSGGFDLKTMQAGPQQALDLVNEGSLFVRRLISFPTPIISACSGHAVAKGAFVLLCSDFRLGVEGDFKIGLNEVAIGMTMHDAGLVMAKHGVTPSHHTRSLLLAEMFDPKEAVKAGFLDKVVPAEQLLPTAQHIAGLALKLNMTAHYQTKMKERKQLLADLDQAIENDRQMSGFKIHTS